MVPPGTAALTSFPADSKDVSSEGFMDHVREPFAQDGRPLKSVFSHRPS